MRNPWARSLTGAATLAALLMHLLAGCCGHHLHAAGQRQPEGTASAKQWHTGQRQPESTASAKQWHTDGEQCDTDRAPGGPKHRHGCDAGRCVFVAAGEGSAAKLGAVSPAAVLAKLAAPADRVERPSDVAPGWNWGHWGPVRLHLLKRVLLV